MAAGSEYQLAIKIAGKLDRSFNTAVKQASTTLKALGAVGSTIGSSVKIAANAFTATSAAVVGVGVASVKAGAEFDSAMSQVAATMGKTMQGMQEEVGTVDLAWGKFSGNLREYALEMGEHTAFSATQSAEALNYMALAGYDTQTSMSMLPNVLNLAAAGSMDLATASDMVTDTQTAFGITLERTSQMVDEMAKAASTGNTSVSQLGDAFLTVGGLAKELNGGIVTLSDGTTSSVDGVQELEIALTAMANAGIKGSEAGTHMRNMLLKLSSPTDSGTKALEALGVSVFDAEGKMRSLSDIFGDLSSSMGNLTQEEKLRAVSDLFNTRDTATAEALLEAVGQDWDKIGESILNAEGAAQQMADVQLDNLAGDVTLFKSALEGVEIAISDTVNPALRNMVQFGTEQLGVLSEAIKTGGLSGLTGAMGGILTEALVEVSSYASNFLNVVFSVSDGIFDALRSNAPRLAEGAATLATQFLSGFIRYYGEFWSTGAELLSEFLFGMIRNMPEIVQSGITMMQGLSEGLTSRFPGIVESARRITVMLIDGLAVMLPQFIETGAELISQLATGVAKGAPSLIVSLLNVVFLSAQSIAEQLPTLASAGITLIGGLLEGILTGLDYIYTSGVDIVLNLVDGLLSALPELIVQAGTVALNFLNGLTDALPTIVEGGMRLIVGLLQGITQNLPVILQTGIQVIGVLAAGILRAMPTLISYLPTLFFGCIDAIFSINWLQVGIDLVKAIWQGLVSAFSELLSAWKSVWSPVASVVLSVMGVIRNGISTAVNVMKTVCTAAWNAIKNTAVSVFGGVYNTIKGKLDAAKTAVTGAVNGIKTTASSAFNAVKSTASSIFGSVYSTIKGKMDSAKNAVSNAINAIKSKFRFHWSLPKLKLPHPSVSGKFSVNPPSVPKFGISWYKQGGILDGAQIFGAAGNNLLGGGEAGKEAVLPLAELWTQMRDIMTEVLQTNDTAPPPTDVLDLLAEKLQAVTAQSPIAQALDALTSGGPQPQPATVNGAPPPPVQITYAPSYHFEGDAPSKDDMTEAARMSQDEFEERLRRWMRDNDRVAF